MADHPFSPPRVGVFDSGVGGLSVLRALHGALPGAALHYLADSAYAPYGDRSAQEVIARSIRLTQHLVEHGARMVVVACNTATTSAIHTLRERWPELPFVGVEPGIKPASLASVNKRIGVLATQRTVSSARLQSLVQTHAADCEVVLRGCPGLVDAIEAGDDAAVRSLLATYCAPLIDARIDTAVLGCTHYPFVAAELRALLGEQVRLIDTADAVARRARELWTQSGAASTGTPRVLLETTGDPARLQAFAQRWLQLEADARHAAL